MRTRTFGAIGRLDHLAGWRRVLAGGFFGLGLILAAPALAQDVDDLWGRGTCSNCHGVLAEGGDPAAELPAGPNLRRTRLDRDQLVETISCGRPGSAMPFSLATAYRETSCYGIPVGEPPAEAAEGVPFTADEIGALVDFLIENAVGQARITRASCAAFFGGNRDYPICAQYR